LEEARVDANDFARDKFFDCRQSISDLTKKTITSILLYDFVEKIIKTYSDAGKTIKGYADMLSVLEEYLAMSGKVRAGPSIVAYYDPILDEIIYNLTPEEIQAALKEKYSEEEIQGLIKFITDHEELHKSSHPEGSYEIYANEEEAVLQMQLRKMTGNFSTDNDSLTDNKYCSYEEAQEFASILSELYFILDSARVSRRKALSILEHLKNGEPLKFAQEFPSDIRSWAIGWVKRIKLEFGQILPFLEVWNGPSYSELIFTPEQNAIIILGKSKSGKSSLAATAQHQGFEFGGEHDTKYIMLSIPGYLFAGTREQILKIRARAYCLDETDPNSRLVPIVNQVSAIGVVRNIVLLKHRPKLNQKIVVRIQEAADLSGIARLEVKMRLANPVKVIHLSHGRTAAAEYPELVRRMAISIAEDRDAKLIYSQNIRQYIKNRSSVLIKSQVEQLNKYADILEILEEYLITSGKLRGGPETVAFFSSTANEVIFNLSEQEMNEVLKEKFSPEEIRALIIFIIDHEDLHKKFYQEKTRFKSNEAEEEAVFDLQLNVKVLSSDVGTEETLALEAAENTSVEVIEDVETKNSAMDDSDYTENSWLEEELMRIEAIEEKWLEQIIVRIVDESLLWRIRYSEVRHIVAFFDVCEGNLKAISFLRDALLREEIFEEKMGKLWAALLKAKQAVILRTDMRKLINQKLLRNIEKKMQEADQKLVRLFNEEGIGQGLTKEKIDAMQSGWEWIYNIFVRVGKERYLIEKIVSKGEEFTRQLYRTWLKFRYYKEYADHVSGSKFIYAHYGKAFDTARKWFVPSAEDRRKINKALRELSEDCNYAFDIAYEEFMNKWSISVEMPWIKYAYMSPNNKVVPMPLKIRLAIPLTRIVAWLRGWQASSEVHEKYNHKVIEGRKIAVVAMSGSLTFANKDKNANKEISRVLLGIKEGSLYLIADDDKALHIRELVSKIMSRIELDVERNLHIKGLLGVLTKLKRKNDRLEIWKDKDIGIVLRELLKNSLRFVQERNEHNTGDVVVEVIARVENGEFILAIKDYGLGFRRINKRKIFLEGMSTKENGKLKIAQLGGLGLYYSRLFVEMFLGCKIHALDNQKDLKEEKLGATFEIVISMGEDNKEGILLDGESRTKRTVETVIATSVFIMLVTPGIVNASKDTNITTDILGVVFALPAIANIVIVYLVLKFAARYIGRMILNNRIMFPFLTTKNRAIFVMIVGGIVLLINMFVHMIEGVVTLVSVNVFNKVVYRPFRWILRFSKALKNKIEYRLANIKNTPKDPHRAKDPHNPPSEEQIRDDIDRLSRKNVLRKGKTFKRAVDEALVRVGKLDADISDALIKIRDTIEIRAGDLNHIWATYRDGILYIDRSLLKKPSLSKELLLTLIHEAGVIADPQRTDEQNEEFARQVLGIIQDDLSTREGILKGPGYFNLSKWIESNRKIVDEYLFRFDPKGRIKVDYSLPEGEEIYVRCALSGKFEEALDELIKNAIDGAILWLRDKRVGVTVAHISIRVRMIDIDDVPYFEFKVVYPGLVDNAKMPGDAGVSFNNAKIFLASHLRSKLLCTESLVENEPSVEFSFRVKRAGIGIETGIRTNSLINMINIARNSMRSEIDRIKRHAFDIRVAVDNYLSIAEYCKHRLYPVIYELLKNMVDAEIIYRESNKVCEKRDLFVEVNRWGADKVIVLFKSMGEIDEERIKAAAKHLGIYVPCEEQVIKGTFKFITTHLISDEPMSLKRLSDGEIDKLSLKTLLFETKGFTTKNEAMLSEHGMKRSDIPGGEGLGLQQSSMTIEMMGEEYELNYTTAKENGEPVVIFTLVIPLEKEQKVANRTDEQNEPFAHKEVANRQNVISIPTTLYYPGGGFDMQAILQEPNVKKAIIVDEMDDWSIILWRILQEFKYRHPEVVINEIFTPEMSVSTKSLIGSYIEHDKVKQEQSRGYLTLNIQTSQGKKQIHY
ncbi:MAG: ATP-binding protein, partial [Candidatus Omnitrophica bacterium]|nr:ATP-binding protein [Candidatus Omnitrophota bacterium]